MTSSRTSTVAASSTIFNVLAYYMLVRALLVHAEIDSSATTVRIIVSTTHLSEQDAEDAATATSGSTLSREWPTTDQNEQNTTSASIQCLSVPTPRENGSTSYSSSTECASVAAQSTTPSGTDDNIASYWQFRQGVVLLEYAPPILIALTTVGNTMSVIVLQNPIFRKSSTSFILSALATADTLVIYTGLLRLFISSKFNIDVRLSSNFGCKLHIMMTYYSRQLSSWTLILLTVERFISVWYPLKSKLLCTRRRVVTSWCMSAVILIGVNSHFFGTFGLLSNTDGSLSCDCMKRFASFLPQQWYWIDACIADLIPFALIFVGNVAIVTGIVLATRRRALGMQGAAVGGNQAGSGKAGDKHQVASTAATLIVVSVLFLMLNIPSDVYFIGYANSVTTTREQDAKLTYFWAVVSALSYVNNSINFLLYLVSGRKFRLAAKDTITFSWCRGGGKPRHTEAMPVSVANGNTRMTTTSRV